MNAHTEIQPYAFDPAGFDHAAFHGFSPPPGATRYDGWTPERQSRFLEAVSEGLTIVQACAIVGLSKQSAYALRTSARGAGFALGWDAAVLLSRNTLVDELMERAFRGNRETIVNADGSIVTRQKHDNRLATTMLARLDRMADRSESGHAAARLVAADFGQYLELIARDGGPARAGMFLGARVEPAAEDELAPIRALARADKWLRTHTDLADPVDTSDLDPAQRAGWTGEQWSRAEAAGLVSLAPEPPENPEASQVGQPESQSDVPDEPVWWDDETDNWRTRFPPPVDFFGEEDGRYGDEDYSRDLSFEEDQAMNALHEKSIAHLRAADTAEREAWLAQAAAPDPGTPDPDFMAEAPPSDTDQPG